MIEFLPPQSTQTNWLGCLTHRYWSGGREHIRHKLISRKHSLSRKKYLTAAFYYKSQMQMLRADYHLKRCNNCILQVRYALKKEWNKASGRIGLGQVRISMSINNISNTLVNYENRFCFLPIPIHF